MSRASKSSKAARPQEAGAATGPSADGSTPAEPTGLSPAPRWLPILGVVIALWATIPKFITPEINTKDSVEVADHVVPGIVVLLVALTALVMQRRRKDTSMFMLASGLIIDLAGLWMVATHVPLVAQALRDEAPWPATIHHTASAVAVMGLGLLWTALAWDPAVFEEEEPKAKKTRKTRKA